MQQNSSLIIACPNCESCFEVDAGSIGPLGKKVRCSDCGFVWVQYRPDTLENPEIAYDPPYAARDTSLRVLRQEAEDHLVLEQAPSFLTNETEQFEDEFLYKERVSHPPSFFSKLFLGLILGSLVFTALFFARYEIAASFPATRPFYAAIGFPVLLVQDFALRQTRWSHTDKGGLPAICIEGEITNNSGATAYPPYLQISMRGEGECKPLTVVERFFGSDKADASGACLLSRWALKVTEGQMLPGQTVPFRAVYPYVRGQRVTEVLLKLTERK